MSNDSYPSAPNQKQDVLRVSLPAEDRTAFFRKSDRGGRVENRSQVDVGSCLEVQHPLLLVIVHDESGCMMGVERGTVSHWVTYHATALAVPLTRLMRRSASMDN